MRKYHRYLKNKGFAEATILQHERNISQFIFWLSANSISLKQFKYSELVRFIDLTLNSLLILHKKRSRINRVLTSITYYFDCLSEKNPSVTNPAKNIRIRNNNKRLVHDLLDYNELINLYKQNNPETPRNFRNQVILGFLICQGFTVRELHNLKVSDIKLREGSILIRGDNAKALRKGTTTRELPLEASQVIDILEYLNNIRPKILSGKYLITPGRKPGRNNRLRRTDQVLLSMNGSPYLKNSLHHLFLDIRKSNSQVISARQLRQSLIAHWLTKYNLRKVQYMAGHRYVSSTEWYKGSNLDELKREVNIFHPLKQ
jgi:integrase/recombinase XerD